MKHLVAELTAAVDLAKIFRFQSGLASGQACGVSTLKMSKLVKLFQNIGSGLIWNQNCFNSVGSRSKYLTVKLVVK